MALGSEIQTLVERLYQGKSEGSLETLAGTNFEALARPSPDPREAKTQTLARPSPDPREAKMDYPPGVQNRFKWTTPLESKRS